MSEAIGLVFRQERNHEPIDSDRLPLRQRMIEDMRLRKLNGKTQLAYVRAVRRLAGFPFAGPAAVLAYLSRYTHRVRAPPQPPNTS